VAKPKDAKDKGAPKEAVGKVEEKAALKAKPVTKAAGAPAGGKFVCSVCGLTRKASDKSSKAGVCKGCADE
jgi:hypothetical protein